MNGICIIYDKDEIYAKRLMQVIGEKKAIPYGVQVFTKEPELISYLDHHTPDLMFVSEECFTYEISQRKEGKLILLMDEEEDIWNRSRKYDQDAVGVYKYQSSDKLLKEVIQLTNCQEIRQKDQVELIGIFTPVEAQERIIFSLNLAKALAKDYKVLYISLEEFSGLDELMPASSNMTLSDVVYYFRQNCGHVDQRMLGAICSAGGVDYIAPVQCAEDIAYIEPEQFIRLMQEIAAGAGYEKVVFDLSYALRQQWKLLLNCDQVYMPVRQDYLSRRKLQAFELYFISQGLENVLEKIHKVDLPDDVTDFNQNFWEQGEYSQLYGAVKELLHATQANNTANQK